MSTEEANLFYTDDDVRSAYSKLRALTQEEFSADGGYKWVFLLQTQVIEQERGLPPEERQRRADLALAEGLVDVFCRVADWIGLRTVDSLTELKQRAEREKYDAYTMLENIASYRSCHSAKLSAKVSNEELFFKGDVLRLKSMIKNEEFYVVPILIQNMILLCDGAERSIGKYRAHGVYNMVRDIYDTWTYEIYKFYKFFTSNYI